MPRTETVIFALGESSLETARKVSSALDAPIVFRGFSLLKPDSGKSDVGSQLREHFQAGRAVVGVCAAGILIRSLAQVLRSKLTEPPVICVADDGSAVVPLLGGHRGANLIAVAIADALGCKAAVTTASDSVLGVALDDPPDRLAPRKSLGREIRIRCNSRRGQSPGFRRGDLVGAAY